MDDTQHQELQRLIDAAPLGAPKKCLPFLLMTTTVSQTCHLTGSRQPS